MASLGDKCDDKQSSLAINHLPWKHILIVYRRVSLGLRNHSVIAFDCDTYILWSYRHCWFLTCKPQPYTGIFSLLCILRTRLFCISMVEKIWYFNDRTILANSRVYNPMNPSSFCFHHQVFKSHSKKRPRQPKTDHWTQPSHFGGSKWQPRACHLKEILKVKNHSPFFDILRT